MKERWVTPHTESSLGALCGKTYCKLDPGQKQLLSVKFTLIHFCVYKKTACCLAHKEPFLHIICNQHFLS